MRNTGKAPSAPIVDIKFRNGIIARGVDPTLMRWEPIDDQPSSYDIVEWQLARHSIPNAA